MSTATQQQQGASFSGDDVVITREAALMPATYNDQDNTIDVVFSTGARGLRYDWASERYYEEELEISEAAVDMTRIEAGVCSALDSHRSWGGVASVVGLAQRGWIEGGKAMATLKLSARQELAGLMQDIKDGIVRAISVGYVVKTWQRTAAADRDDGGQYTLMRAVRWMPYEISFVAVPFDAGASTRSGASSAAPGDIYPLDAFTARAHAGLLPRQAAENPQAGQTLPRQSAAITRALQALAAPQAAPQPPIANDNTRAMTTPATQQQPQQQQPAQSGDTTAQRAADIVALCVRHGVADRAADMITRGLSLADAGLEILNQRADAQGGGGRVNVTTVRDEGQTMLRGLEEAIMHRMDPRAQLSDNGRQYRGYSLMEMGRAWLEQCGENTRSLNRMDLAGRALSHRSGGMHTTSDFGSLLVNSASKRLRAAYEESRPTYTLWARRAPNAPDFKTMTVVQLSGAPDLLKTNEAGEFSYGKINDAGATYAVATYGRIVTFSRQAMLNDDLRGLDRMITAFGSASARLENRLAYSQITANGAMSDAKSLFHTDHGNLGSAALDLTALGAGRAAMRKQKGLQSEELNITPSFLIVPTALEQVAYQLTSANYVPAKVSDTNEFRAGGRTALEPIVDPVLDSSSATAWYLAASSGQVDTVEYCWIDGTEGPVISTDTDFDSDGLKIKCREDFAAKVIDWRGLYKSTT